MSLTLAYNIRHLATRRTATAMTTLGIALVVFVFVASRMLAAGLRETLAATGSPTNAIVIRNGAQNEIQSGLLREHAQIVLAEPEVAKTAAGEPIATLDCVIIVSLNKRADGAPSNVTVRGTSATAGTIRPAVHLIAGRMPNPGSSEVIVGSAVQKKFQNTDLGSAIRMVGTNWAVVGIFDAGQSAFNSEIWGDVEVMMPAFRRDRYSSVTFKLMPGIDFDAFRNRIENDRRLTVSMKREDQFYSDQSRALGTFITIIGTFVSVVFGLGAVVGAMITMYSSVAHRVREIGILRALGFRPLTIFFGFVKECLLIAAAGGITGLLLASGMLFVGISTTNFTTFSDLAFGFALTPGIALRGLIFALIMGFIGGALPALRAARINLLQALRSE